MSRQWSERHWRTRPRLVPYAGRFDGFHAVPASVSKTCLVRFDRNRYSVDARAVGRPVEIRAYADRIEIRQDGQVVGRHDRVFGRDHAVYDPLHYLPVLARKPGALRNGAPFKDWELPPALRRIRRKLERVPGGDRQMVEILATLLTDGIETVEAACAEALDQGVHSADVVLNILARRHAAGVLSARRPGAPGDTYTASGTDAGAGTGRRLRPIRHPEETRPWKDRRFWTRHAKGVRAFKRGRASRATGQLKLVAPEARVPRDGMKAAYDETLAAAVKRQHDPQKVIGELLQAEISEKQARSIKYQLAVAKLPLAKEIAEFQFEDTSINETLVRDLTGGGFLNQQRNVVLIGGTGTGKAGAPPVRG